MESKKTTYVKIDSVVDLIQQIKQKHIETLMNTEDQLRHAFESARIGVLTDVHVAVICDIERFTADQVAAEDAEEMVNAEGAVYEIVDVLEDMVRDENTDHILIQGHDRKGWTDEEVFNDRGEAVMRKLADEIAYANKGHGEIWVYSKGLKNETFTELQILQHMIEPVIAEIRRRVQ